MKTVVGMVLVLGCLSPMVFADGILFTGTDELTFAGTSPPDQLGKSTVSGATETGGGIISTAFRMNGLGGGAGFLYTGDPFSNNLITMDYDGNLLTSVSGKLQPRRRLLQRGSDGFGRKSIPRLLRSVPG